IGDDAVEPGVEGRLALECTERPPHLEKRLLDDVASIVGMFDHTERDAVGLALVTLHERPECLAIAASGTRDQSRIFLPLIRRRIADLIHGAPRGFVTRIGRAKKWADAAGG